VNPRGAAVSCGRGATVSGRSWRVVWRAVLVAALLLLAGSPLWAQAPPEAIEYYARDAVGSVRIVFDVQGNVLGRSDYLPFGETWNQSGALPRQRFTGQARDGEAGLDDFNARAYQPLFGRFTRPDPISGNVYAPQSWNAYAYVQNRPLVATDPSGMQTYYLPYNPLPPTLGEGQVMAWVWLRFHLLGNSFYSYDGEFDGLERGGGLGGGKKQQPGDGDVVVGDTGDSGNGKSGNTGTSTGTGTGTGDGQKKKQEDDLKDRMRCAARFSDTHSLAAGFSAVTGVSQDNLLVSAFLGSDASTISDLYTGPDRLQVAVSEGKEQATEWGAKGLVGRVVGNLPDPTVKGLDALGTVALRQSPGGTFYAVGSTSPTIASSLFGKTIGKGFAVFSGGKAIWDGLTYGAGWISCQ
jgi:RHS repeat-associated protein